jgi:hypothetical protein
MTETVLQREYRIECEGSDRRRNIQAIQESALELVGQMAVKLDGVSGTTSARYWISQHTLDVVKDAIRRTACIDASTTACACAIDQVHDHQTKG